ncbi:pre-mRNA-splicing factor prp46 [Eremomyces bilateralis CBS 781.70]|uniref:Pre-mRNA-splicing factor PRP46 n=1 Tax=Eremomyces bilateralis CBS 781.70 TaxID=1392243 RepID=A0A6G1GHD3_9PEZI|nr:pre-mRNA-splicing factor prp46 [Eremomyces bilateralis CBS 781.70]KAF1817311.1 pre-mRNA-splicing factor prp46 [Eremomyces bilateralis CBS 781.70]
MADVDVLIKTSAKRTRELFASDFASTSQLASSLPTPYSVAPIIPSAQEQADKLSITSRIRSEYANAKELPPALAAKQASAASVRRKKPKTQAGEGVPSDPKMAQMIEGITERDEKVSGSASNALIVRQGGNRPNIAGGLPTRDAPSSSLIRRENIRQPKPEWHAPWKLKRVVSGHLGWVRALAVEPGNKWFCSGAGDRTIKLWDLASGTLKLTLTGHISTVRGLAVSPRHPYLFSCGEDKKVLNWDLETNKVIRHFHGHLSGVYTLALHPTLDVLITGGRDGVARVWDMRSRSNIHVLSGHKGTVSNIQAQEADPQIITSSLDSTVRLWDLAAGKTMGVLTHHKKGVRALTTHPEEFTFASASTGSIKQWKCPEGAFMQNFEAPNCVINTLAVNQDNVMVAGGDDGSMSFFDWKTGHRFQSEDSIAQPGSLAAEAGIMCATFDRTGARLITGEADKTIKVWAPDTTATEETHPMDWTPTLGRQKF